ncbi:hypothetical protein [uncultured Clostridium sp.]|uniref:hypothetical protein n=1 Tax=uncultured Clostridium sp. TaxID=59620 RepID=UPI0025E17EBD|nr:hypothetical protein [uncultured Clostridium sp.]
MGKTRKHKGIILLFFFLISLYLVEEGIAGSSIVADYNNGYGTFDMKQYDVSIVRNVLSGMQNEGFMVYKYYYFFDFIFVVAFGLFQIYLSLAVYKWCTKFQMQMIICAIPVLRGIFDIVENILLFNTLCTFPNINASIIRIASICTKCKIGMIKLWIVELIVGLLIGIINYYKNKRK